MDEFRVGLIGTGIGDSLTPALHMREARILGLGYDYTLIERAGDEDSAQLRRLLVELREEGYAAVNVTHPYKQRMLAALDSRSDEAQIIEAVNLVHVTAEGFAGGNTDWSGFAWALGKGLPGADLGSVVQYGAGGAGGATAYALLRSGCRSLTITDSDPARAADLAARFAPLFPDRSVEGVATDAAGEALRTADGVVHATPVGMRSHPGVAVPVGLLSPDAWVAEIVYFPVETELVLAARAGGHRVLEGTWMAVGQAIDSLRLITGREPDTVRMAMHMANLLEEAR